MKTVVLLSGGIDSTACMELNALVPELVPVFVEFGQPAEVNERRAATRIAAHYDVDLTVLSVRGVEPSSHGFIPHRNLILLACGMLATRNVPTTLVIGIHAGTQYPDCSPPFIRAVQDVGDLSARGTLTISAPLLTWTKQEIIGFCRHRSVPVDVTWSCEQGGKEPCRTCFSCRDRELLDD